MNADTQPRSTLAWFAAWTCGCATARPARTGVSERCPGHDRPLISKATRIPVFTKYADTHVCDDHNPCPTTEEPS